MARHAGPASAIVRLSYQPDRLVVEVVDNGRAPAANGKSAPGSGTGIAGMRERAAIVGGQLEAGPRPGGGFAVAAELPLGPPEPTGTEKRRHEGADGPARAIRAGRASRASGPRGQVVIRVLLADDQALVRAGFKALLDARDDIEVVGEAADGAQAISLAKTLLPDVVLMDIRMPVLDGLQATQAITADPRLGGVRIVILTTFELDEYLFEALRYGASGFLVKDTEPVDLVTAVRVVAQGDSLISPGMTRRLVAEFASRSKAPRPATELGVLTEREREVMALVAGGLTNEEIAERLYMSPATARTHVSRAMTKLGARDRTQLVVLAYETGLVRPGWLA